jgi:hypothetical protein
MKKYTSIYSHRLSAVSRQNFGCRFPSVSIRTLTEGFRLLKGVPTRYWEGEASANALTVSDNHSMLKKNVFTLTLFLTAC